jgi:beta-carotene hydroxylase
MYTPAQISKIVPRPSIAWPTILLTLGCAVTEVTVIYLMHNNVIPGYCATILNSFVIYAVFTPMHDASHGSVATASHGYINTCVGVLSGLCFPLPFHAFKNIHLLHHKHTNDGDLDPDNWAGKGPKWLLPFRWMTIEIKYYAHYLPRLFSRPASERLTVVIILLGIILSIVVLLHCGFQREVIWGWIIPGRVAQFFLAYFFDYLPHRPHAVPRRVDPYIATGVTSLFGKQTAWLTWPLLHQNYHNIHHIAPYIPFYQYSIVWHQLKDELIAKGTKVQSIF